MESPPAESACSACSAGCVPVLQLCLPALPSLPAIPTALLIICPVQFASSLLAPSPFIFALPLFIHVRQDRRLGPAVC